MLRYNRPSQTSLFMKAQRQTRGIPGQTGSKNLTLGELIVATYRACGAQGAPKVLELALESNLVRFAQRPSY